MEAATFLELAVLFAVGLVIVVVFTLVLYRSRTPAMTREGGRQLFGIWAVWLVVLFAAVLAVALLVADYDVRRICVMAAIFVVTTAASLFTNKLFAREKQKRVEFEQEHMADPSYVPTETEQRALHSNFRKRDDGREE